MTKNSDGEIILEDVIYNPTPFSEITAESTMAIRKHEDLQRSNNLIPNVFYLIK